MGTNTLTNLTRTKLLARSFQAYRFALLPFKQFATNFSGDFADKSRLVDIPWINYTPGGYEFNGTYQFGDTDAESKQMSLSFHTYVSWSFTDTELMYIDEKILNDFARDKGLELAKLVSNKFLAHFTVANFGSAVYTGSSSGFDSDKIIDIGTTASTDEWPQASRFMGITPAYFGNVVKDPAVKWADRSGSTDALRLRQIGALGGFSDITESNSIPDNSENLVGYAARPDAVALAMRLLDPGEGSEKVLTYQPFTDKPTGISMAYRNWYDPDTGTSKSVIECLGGSRVLNPDAAYLIHSA